jgi:putative SOS response-associated peptidase YedK
MCGRFFQDILEEDLRAYFEAESTAVVSEAATRPRYNIGPGQEILVVRARPEHAGRSLDAVHWGLIPHFAEDRKGAYRSINARAETVDRAPSYRGAFAKRRCLVVAHGFYEWTKQGKQKLPWAIQREDGQPLALAGIWENWLDPGTGEWLRSAAIITVDANPQLKAVHERMPAILEPASFALWLGEQEATRERLKALLVPSAEPLRVWRVDPRMNRTEVDDAAVLTPVAQEPVKRP